MRETDLRRLPGVHGNHLAQASGKPVPIRNNLPLSEARKPYTRRADGRAAWKDVRGRGRGVGSIDDGPATSDLVDRLAREYRDALDRPRAHDA
jgi:nitronate monooxygenase